MSLFYRAERVGKHGRIFTMYKINTLREGTGSYAHEREYTFGGKFLRKWKLDELPQLWNWIRGDIALFGPRPREKKEIDVYPEHIREKLLSVKPGLICLAGIYFIDEERILALSDDPTKDYFGKILPTKLTLDIFYIENRCWLLNIAMIWMALKARILN